MDYRTAAPQEGACPRCARALTPLEVEGATLLVCHKSCGGLFADVDASRRVLAGIDRQLLAVAHEVALGKPELDGGPSMHCPICLEVMARAPVPAAVVSVDACAVHGTWFDAHELQKVMRVREAQRRRGPARPTAAAGPGYTSGEDTRDPLRVDPDAVLASIRALFD